MVTGSSSPGRSNEIVHETDRNQSTSGSTISKSQEKHTTDQSTALVTGNSSPARSNEIVHETDPPLSGVLRLPPGDDHAEIVARLNDTVPGGAEFVSGIADMYVDHTQKLCQTTISFRTKEDYAIFISRGIRYCVGEKGSDDYFERTVLPYGHVVGVNDDGKKYCWVAGSGHKALVIPYNPEADCNDNDTPAEGAVSNDAEMVDRDQVNICIDHEKVDYCLLQKSDIVPDHSAGSGKEPALKMVLGYKDYGEYKFTKTLPEIGSVPAVDNQSPSDQDNTGPVKVVTGYNLQGKVYIADGLDSDENV